MMNARNTLGLAHLTLLASLIVTGSAWGAIGIDANVVTNQATTSTTVQTVSFSTTTGNELLLAFITTDAVSSPNTTVTSVTGAGLTWVLVQRTNVQLGTAEIWRAFSASSLTNVTVTATLSQQVASSMTVLSFNGVNTSGTNGSGAIGAVGTGNANPGAPTAMLVTQGNGSLVVGVGNDWDNAIARTPGTGQSVVHQYFPPAQDTYWVQMQNSPIPLSGTSVTINDTAPTGDRYNLSIVEVLAAAGGGGSGFTVSGTINPVAAGTGTTVTLSQNGTTAATTSANSSGTYSFANIANGTYTVTPANSAFNFNPTSQSVTVSGANANVPVFNTAPTGTAAQHVQSCTPASVGGFGIPTFTTITCNNVGAHLLAVGVAYECCNHLSDMTVSDGQNAFVATPAGKPNPGSSVPSCFANGGNQVASVFYHFYNSAPGNVTITATLQANEAITLFADEFSGVGTLDIDACGTSNTGTTINTPSTTPAGANEVQYAACAAGGNVPVGGTTPWTQVNTGVDAEWLITTGANSQAPVFNPQTGGLGWACVNAAFKSSGGGGTGSTGSIIGTINPAAAGTGTKVTLSQNGTVVATTAATSSGTYTFSNVTNGTYTVTPSETGFTFSPANQSVTVNGNAATVPAFTATALSGSISGTITPPANGNGAVVTLSQGGTTVATFTVGASGSYTFNNVANGTYTVTPTEAGFTFSPASQNVTVSGNAATVPVFTATQVTWTISGTITPAVSGATVTLTQGATTIGTAAVSSSGTYSFSNVPNGTYAVTPSNTGFTFSPASQPATVSGGNVTVPNFTATAVPTWTISGTITPAASGSGALVTLSGTASQTATADNSGNYTFTGLVNGNYAVTPSKAGLAFSPTSQSVPINGGNATVPSFMATAVSTWTISGTIAGGSSTTVTLAQSGTTIGTAVADVSGNYSFANIANGTYTITPSKTGFTFSPTIQSVPINGANAININFTATDVSTFKYPDLSDIIPTAAIAVVQTLTGKQFQYTHDTYNGGPGPLVIQPAYNPATGNYQGTQYIYSQSSSGIWSLTKQIPVAGTFVFHAIHGHFHFPFASYGIYNVGPGGGPSTLVVPSAKIGFCIADSFIYNSTLPNAGALGNLGSCSDPTSLRGLDIGAVDEYDKTDDGQSISIDGVPDGTYWLRAIVDPNNFFAEADKTNNETDVKFTLSGTNIQVLQTVVPVLAQPPAISMTSPSAGSTVTGIVQFTASTATTGGVQYLVDGRPFGSVVTSAPYTLSWDSSTVVNGTHWLAAQTTGQTGVIGTSPVVAVTVSNSGPTIPAVQVTSPANGSIVSAIITLYATVASSQTIANVKFFVDNVAVGQPVTSPPYSISWDTTTATAGTHVITATATDIAGNVGTSAQVTVTVDNTHPAKLIGKDVQISVDGSGTLTTAPFSTTTPGDLLIAFVAYDGPLTSPQTAIVTGAGLTWSLLIRSNTQAGTSEIWSARATGTLSSVTVSSHVGVGSGFHGSLTVIAFTNAAGTSVVGRTGAPTGAPDIFLPGVVAGDWVFAAGNDWDNAIARTLVSGQVLVHQRVDTQVGDTYWVQSTAAPSTANALVDIHDSAPTSDRWNYAAVEIVATRQ